MHVLAASAQTCRGDRSGSLSCVRASAISATVWVTDRHSAKHCAQSSASSGTRCNEEVITSTALLSCFRVTVWAETVCAIPESASLSNDAASCMPENISAPSEDLL